MVGKKYASDPCASTGCEQLRLYCRVNDEVCGG